MNFKQQIAKYRTGNLSDCQLPDIAILGMQEGLDSESLVILAGLSKNESSFVIIEYFEKALEELKLRLPERREAALLYADGLIDDILNGKRELIDGIYEIKDDAINSFDFFSESKKYCYDSIGFEAVYALFEDYYDINEYGSSWSEKKKTKMKNKIKTELLLELKKWKNIIKNGV
ncbi:hypothetical protein DMA11_04035 [Marinilabiliaceae bacterium JC017]|nr:hypothetical protein DMA11_04035 [Marinilabiliaceae bacterium JC017]